MSCLHFPLLPRYLQLKDEPPNIYIKKNHQIYILKKKEKKKNIRRKTDNPTNQVSLEVS
jgi:hypothetical protein